MTLYTYDHGGGTSYGEQHDLVDGATEPNGWWDAFFAELPVVPPEEQVDNTNTVHACEANNGSTLIWALEAFGFADGGRVGDRIDCVVIVESDAQADWVEDFLDYHKPVADLSGCDQVRGWTKP